MEQKPKRKFHNIAVIDGISLTKIKQTAEKETKQRFTDKKNSSLKAEWQTVSGRHRGTGGAYSTRKLICGRSSILVPPIFDGFPFDPYIFQ